MFCSVVSFLFYFVVNCCCYCRRFLNIHVLHTQLSISDGSKGLADYAEGRNCSDH